MKENTRQKLKEFNCCVIIPTYNNEKTLASIIANVRQYVEQVIVVNDGSTDSTPDIIRSFNSTIHCCDYPKNQGKGFALQTGFSKAISLGFDYAITIDSDGQHFPEDIRLFADQLQKCPDALLIGSRNLAQENMPGKNSFANRFSNFWFHIETGHRLDDTQSGFRLYPLKKIGKMNFFTKKYDFELEILVRSAWKGIPVISIPIQVYYAPAGERISHFKPWKDFTRISLLNTVLVLVAFLWVKPFSFVKNLNKKNIRQFVYNHILASSDSNKVLAFSILLGVFMGIVPIWGYQMIIAFTLAHFLKLNKVVTLVASNISIPPMIPLILFGSYSLGAVLLNNPLKFSIKDIKFETVQQDLIQYIVGSFALAAICALFAGGLSYALLCVFRKKKSI